MSLREYWNGASWVLGDTGFIPGRARLVFQYDATKDYQARDPRGVPVDLKNNAWFLRLQVEL